MAAKLKKGEGKGKIPEGGGWSQNTCDNCAAAVDLEHDPAFPPSPHPLPQGEGRASIATKRDAAPSPLVGEGWGGGGTDAKEKPPPFPAGASHCAGCVLARTAVLPVFANHDPSRHWQLHRTQPQRLARHVFANTVDLEHDPARFDLGRPVVGRALAFTHPHFDRF